MNRLSAFLAYLKFWFWTAPVSLPEMSTDHAPEPPQTPFRVTMPGKYRPYILTSHATHLEAVLALELLAATFAADGWFVHRDAPGFWRLHKCVDGEDLITRLEIVTSDVLAKVT